MATVANTLTFARAQAQTDSNGITDANGIEWANEALVDFHRRLIASGVDASQLQESYRDGAIDQATYLYPTDMWFLKAIEVNYGGTDPKGYVTAEQVDVSNLPAGISFSEFRSSASINSPKFDDRGDWFEIYPTPTGANNVSQLIRIFYFKEPTEYTTTSDAIAYPTSLDHRILGWRIAANYYYAIGKMEEADRFIQKYEERVQQLINTLSRGSQQPLTATPLQITGWEF
jgi:hypothetical protein